MTIEILCVVVRATVDGKGVELAFTPSQKGLPGLITEIFRNIKMYLNHNREEQS